MILFYFVLMLVIGGIFIVIGVGSVWVGYKVYRYYYFFYVKEVERDYV